jgi:hypothetical protein
MSRIRHPGRSGGALSRNSWTEANDSTRSPTARRSPRSASRISGAVTTPSYDRGPLSAQSRTQPRPVVSARGPRPPGRRAAQGGMGGLTRRAVSQARSAHWSWAGKGWFRAYRTFDDQRCVQSVEMPFRARRHDRAAPGVCRLSAGKWIGTLGSQREGLGFAPTLVIREVVLPGIL